MPDHSISDVDDAAMLHQKFFGGNVAELVHETGALRQVDNSESGSKLFLQILGPDQRLVLSDPVEDGCSAHNHEDRLIAYRRGPHCDRDCLTRGRIVPRFRCDPLMKSYKLLNQT